MAKNLIQSFESGHVFSKQQKSVLIVYAHHEPKSFNGALLRKAVETLEADGHSVEVSDLYAMHFEPRSGRTDIVGSVQDESFFKYQVETKSAFENGTLSDDIKVEVEKLKRADLVIFQFPLYWFSFPAIMKGWIERIFVSGFAYGMGKMYSDGPLKGKRGMLSFTTGGPGPAFHQDGLNGDINVLLWPLQGGALRFVGLDVLAPQIHYAPAHVTDDDRKQWLDDWAKRLHSIFEEPFLKFVDSSNFTNLKLRGEYHEGESSKQYGPTVGQNLGKPFSPTGMLKP
ncbi:ribosyldihydronicotinamide dehydrogenase [quinone]-like [Haliotis rubra]|uniref:ribosyldihydronicotinamide dehydrogenase [quinone]-like n=1 Tax=Haliotis rubra TaxID=36100 RepID=UPI001EE5A1FF|nr:ribosyldihydronicotinamide dehydrogenase [quinone]-like [Haliotis rubra]